MPQQGLPLMMVLPPGPAAKLMLVKATWQMNEDDPDIKLPVIPGGP